MELKLNDSYVITTDQYNYTLNKILTNKKNGEEYLSPVGYYSNLNNLIDSLINKEIRESDVKSISGVLEVIEDVRKDIVKHLEEFNL